MIRLDLLKERSGVELWIQTGEDAQVHITGVGVLNGSDSTLRLLADGRKTLLSQTAWQGICRGIAQCFLQVMQGGRPTHPD